MQTRKLTKYHIHTGRLTRPVDFAVVSDLHDEPYDDLWPLLDGADALLVPGDVCDRYRQSSARGVAFLKEAADRLPTFFSLGNHETRQKQFRLLVGDLERTGAEVLINRYVRFGECWIGGWYPPSIVREPDMMDQFEKLDGVKVLLCHKPEHYIKFMRGRALDLVVAGHAHGGQIRLPFIGGLLAPEQGLFPKYTSGVHKLGAVTMVISRGLGNSLFPFRIFNRPEVVCLQLKAKS